MLINMACLDKTARTKEIAVVKKVCPVCGQIKQPYLLRFEILIIISVFHSLIFEIHFLLL